MCIGCSGILSINLIELAFPTRTQRFRCKFHGNHKFVNRYGISVPTNVTTMMSTFPRSWQLHYVEQDLHTLSTLIRSPPLFGGNRNAQSLNLIKGSSHRIMSSNCNEYRNTKSNCKCADQFFKIQIIMKNYIYLFLIHIIVVKTHSEMSLFIQTLKIFKRFDIYIYINEFIWIISNQN